MTTRIPSSLTRSQGAGAPDRQPRREPTAAQRAMMTSSQLRAYYERRGEWGVTQEWKDEHFPFQVAPTGRRP